MKYKYPYISQINKTETTKGPKPSKTLSQILEKAVEIADKEGMEALSLRKLAKKLNMGVNSLYNYIENKEELLILMLDFVEENIGAPPSNTTDWIADLEKFANKIRKLILSHPWLTDIAAARPNFGPNALQWNEYAMNALNRIENSPDEKIVNLELIQSFVRGFTTRELSAKQLQSYPDNLNIIPDKDFNSYIEHLLNGDKFPNFRKIVTEAKLPHINNREEIIFQKALTKLLDAIGTN